MGFVKHGTGEVLAEGTEIKKVAESDEKQVMHDLQEENDRADSDSDD